MLTVLASIAVAYMRSISKYYMIAFKTFKGMIPASIILNMIAIALMRVTVLIAYNTFYLNLNLTWEVRVTVFTELNLLLYIKAL